MHRNKTWLVGWVLVWLLTMAPAHAAGSIAFSDDVLANVAAPASSFCCTEVAICEQTRACQGACPCIGIHDCSNDTDGSNSVGADVVRAFETPDELEPAPDPFPPKPRIV